MEDVMELDTETEALAEDAPVLCDWCQNTWPASSLVPTIEADGTKAYICPTCSQKLDREGL